MGSSITFTHIEFHTYTVKLDTKYYSEFFPTNFNELAKMSEHMSSIIQNNYRTGMNRALEKFQFIEETLKMCLLSATKIATIQLSPFFPFCYKNDDISKLPLGPLIKKFKRINNDGQLHQDLQNITKQRNLVAHQSLLFTIGDFEDVAHMTEETLIMKEIANRAEEIHNQLLKVRYEFTRLESKARSCP